MLRQERGVVAPISLKICLFKREGGFGLLGGMPPEMIEADVGGDAIDPGREAGLASKA